MTQTAVRKQTTVTQEPKTKCVDCRWRDADMAEHCDLHTQRREVNKERIVIVACTGYVYEPPRNEGAQEAA